MLWLWALYWVSYRLFFLRRDYLTDLQLIVYCNHLKEKKKKAPVYEARPSFSMNFLMRYWIAGFGQVNLDLRDWNLNTLNTFEVSRIWIWRNPLRIFTYIKSMDSHLLIKILNPSSNFQTQFWRIHRTIKRIYHAFGWGGPGGASSPSSPPGSTKALPYL